MKIKIITDSSCDLPLKYVKENIELLHILGMPISMNQNEYMDDLGETFTHDFFYAQLVEGVLPKTSQINTMTFYDSFSYWHKRGFEIIYLGLSSGLSGTYNNAVIAKDMLLEEVANDLSAELNNAIPEIYIIDSLAASVGLGALIVQTVVWVKEEINCGSVVSKVEEAKLYTNHWFAVDDLMHLKNGGRIPTAAAVIGTMLNVKPILTMSVQGKLESHSTVRGKKKAIKYLVSKVVGQLTDESTVILIGHANIKEDADAMVDELKSRGVLNTVVETCLSATIASHVGPGMLAIAFLGNKERENKKSMFDK